MLNVTKTVYQLIGKYKQYKLKYEDKMLICKQPMLVSDFVTIKKLIEKLDIKEIRIVGR